MPAKIKLYMFPGSNSVYTGRLMLEHKGLDYRTVTLMPGAHAFILLALGFETMGAPASGWDVTYAKHMADACAALGSNDRWFPANSRATALHVFSALASAIDAAGRHGG